ncbi:hypothetical protein SASPL_156928 [Salvia splendens]|uniref:Protein kinase domain-containing protein n=1 Tax=Salvia splendens TaxID=180675 RepID=A0A8X8YVZ9_SALSN|nr:hypothetical protein SASPL_156928 [Salvia splendens]
MPSWWGKSSSKEAKKKSTKESFIDTFHKKFKSPESKSSGRSAGSRRRSSDIGSERGTQSRAPSRSPSPSKNVARCQSFVERPQSQPLPVPGLRPANVSRTDSGTSETAKPKPEKSKPSLFLPLPRPACIRQRLEPAELDAELAVASVCSECSIESDDPVDSRQRSPLANDYDIGRRTAAGSPSSISLKDQAPLAPIISKVAPHGAFSSAPDSSRSSPSRSPMRASGYEPVSNTVYTTGKLYTEFPFLGSGQCSPGSGQTSGHNSMGGDMSGQLFWQPSRGSPEYSPNPSPRMTSPGPSSRIHSGAVTPLHPRAGGVHSESQGNWPDDKKQPSYALPLPPISVSNSSPFSHQNSAVTSPSVPRSPGRTENLTSPGSTLEEREVAWSRHIWTCEIMLLSRLRHPNIVQYYGSETVGDKLYIYLEYVSGGSIHKILQDYGKLGESAIRRANILVDPNGRVKLADFGMAKHITGHSCPLSFKGSPYWMAPEVIRNSNGCSLAVDIWSLGCTVIEMATSKPPWSQYEGVAAMFKIGNSKELPTIPDHLSDEGKDL